MDGHTDSLTSDTAAAPGFFQVLYVGRPGGDQLIEALRRDGVGVIVAFDPERAVRLLCHFRPDAILCAPADASILLPHAEPNVPVLTLVQDDPRRSPVLASTSVSVAGSLTMNAAAVAQRVREEIAALRHLSINQAAARNSAKNSDPSSGTDSPPSHS